ncbi:MAG TPA: 50S ribosomal protein L19 [Planctomycetes bacterium]|nr:50S ribosomal protein L19 [Planctomycetota bacterium]
MNLIDELGNELGKKKLPVVHVGDTVQVHYLIREGEKERIQLFTGTILAIQGRGIARSIVVRRIVQGEGVERIFPLHSPRVKDVTITRRGKVRQARLYYLRDRVGKRTRVEELVGEKVRRERLAAKEAAAAEAQAVAAAAAAAEAAENDDPEPEAVEA